MKWDVIWSWLRAIWVYIVELHTCAFCDPAIHEENSCTGQRGQVKWQKGPITRRMEVNGRGECWNARGPQEHWGRSVESDTTNIKNETNPEGIEYKIQQCLCVCVICKLKYIENSIKYIFIFYQESCWAYRCMHIITKKQIFLLLSLRNKTLYVKSNSMCNWEISKNIVPSPLTRVWTNLTLLIISTHVFIHAEAIYNVILYT